MSEPSTLPRSSSEPNSSNGSNTNTNPTPRLRIGEPETEITRWLRDQYAEIARVTGALAHEIRNPLSTIRMNLDLLAEDFQNPQTARDKRILSKIERVRSEGQRLQNILEDFLRFARVQEPRTRLVDLHAVIDDLRDFFEPQATVHEIVTRAHYCDNLPPIPLDVDLFKQALLNLMLNAQQAMTEGGELILTTRREGDFAVLDVVDTGSGIALEAQPKVFEAFYSSRPGGSGLGLPTARKIVESHGGFLRLQSVPGKGSKFSIWLPLIAPGVSITQTETNPLLEPVVVVASAGASPGPLPPSSV